MKTTKKIIITLLLAICCTFGRLLTVCPNNQTLTAKALVPEYVGGAGNIYYFSDSEPFFKNELGSNAVYDTHDLLTMQELSYMLHSGYFWGFCEDEHTLVIIEIKATKPDVKVLTDLVECLHAQGCRVLFISPYQEFEEYDCGADASMPCEYDEYAKFLKNAIRSYKDEDEVYNFNGGTLLIDGRFIGVDGEKDYDVYELLLNSRTFRRLVSYMSCECNEDSESDFEASLYNNLWNNSYYNYYMRAYGYQLNYFEGYEDINAYIEMWKELLEIDPNYFDNVRAEYGEYFDAEYKSYVKTYYGEIIKERFGDFHFVAHAGGNVYYDMFNVNPQNDSPEKYYLYDWMELFDTFNVSGNYFRSMGIYRFEKNFYNLIAEMQVALKFSTEVEEYENVLTLVFTWFVDPYVPSEYGISIITPETLNLLYGHGCGECAECKKYDREQLVVTLEDCLRQLSWF